MITPGPLYVTTETRNAILILQEPTNTTELRFFMSLCNVYLRSAPSFARKATPVNKLLEKRQPTKSDKDEGVKIAADELKTNSINQPILTLPREEASSPLRQTHAANKLAVSFCVINRMTTRTVTQLMTDGKRRKKELESRAARVASRRLGRLVAPLLRPE